MSSLASVQKHLAALRACERCPRMHRPAVVGRPAVSRVVLVGQAPGDKEPKLGRPFAWTAGKTLFKWFHGALGWTEDEVRDRIYFAAVCRCFPGKRPEGLRDAGADPLVKREAGQQRSGIGVAQCVGQRAGRHGCRGIQRAGQGAGARQWKEFEALAVAFGRPAMENSVADYPG